MDENNEIDDLTLYSLGLLSEKEIEVLMDAALNHKTVDYEVEMVIRRNMQHGFPYDP